MATIISRNELKVKIDERLSNYVLVDVREKDELKFGMIPTAINIPLDELESKLSDSNKFDKSMEIIFYCRTGARSSVASEKATGLGFVNVKNYRGSIWDWSEIDSNVRRYGPRPN